MIEHEEQQLGNYRLKQVLGRGAFADVYLGEHLYLATPVAVKILHSRPDSSALADFLTEARHVSHLVHPHTIRVFDFGLESDIPYLVMDYAPHGNLREMHPSGRIVPLSTIVSYVTDLASALQYAHERHLIHRDLKPENVLLGSNHEVLLSDFSLALHASESETPQVQERYGTLSYMAPEQISGKPVPASDQYALAVMVYEWLWGHLPFEGSLAHLTNQHLYTDPPALCDERPDLPRAVEQVVLRGLSKEPAQRYADMLSFARALQEASLAVSSPHIVTAQTTTPHAETRYSLDSQDMGYRNVPLPLTAVIGCERELEEVRALLLHPQVRLLTLDGAGGIGKTRLALSLAHEMLGEFAQGVCFVSLATIDDSELVIPAIVGALGLQEMSDSSAMHLLKTSLRDMHLLLVLDGFEQLLQAAPLLAEVLGACSGLKVLVTSRALLHIGGEFTFTVPPLEVPDLQCVPDRERLSQIASVALFVQRARAVQPAFQLTDENALDIAAICAQLEGVPLAIELAAEQCRVLSPSALLSRLHHPSEVLVGTRRDAPLRQQTLLKTLDWNEDLLSPDERTLFRRFAVFSGGCSLQALEAVSMALGDLSISVLNGVRALVDKSLLQCSVCGGDESRLSCLEMVRAYALERLAEGGELERARQAHATYYLALAEKAESVMDDPEVALWREGIECESENLRAALQWLLESRKGEEALRLATALKKFWALPDYQSLGRGFLEQALKVSSECQTPVSRALRAKALYAAGWLAYLQHDPDSATPLLEESMRLSNSLGDKQSEASALTCLSTICYDQGGKGIATALLKEGVKLYRETGERTGPVEKEERGEATESPPASLPRSQLRLAERFTEPLAPVIYEELTARETEVLRLLAQGLRNKRIAECLVISPHTVNGHIHSIFGKLALSSRSAATRYALEHQLA